MIEAKAFRIYIRIYTQFKREQLSANIKLTSIKALIRSVMTYTRLTWELAAENLPIKIAAPTK
jgi:hypothetical protein